MTRVEMDTVIKMPMDKVFERLVDISGYSKWMPKSGIFIKSGQTSAGPVDKGTTFYDKGRMGTFKGEISDFERPTKIAFRESVRWLGMKGMEARPSYRLEAVDGGTRVHHVSEGQFYGMFNLMQPMAAVIGRGERKRVLNALKKSLESSS
jgi:uncharacterized protein YndB with AHSA1/START domain